MNTEAQPQSPIACKFCKWWDSYFPHGPGDCRRNAPIFADTPFDPMDNRRKWPKTSAEDYCGQFEAKTSGELPDSITPHSKSEEPARAV